MKLKNTVWVQTFVFLFFVGCSTSSNLRKFEEGDMSKEISEEIAKKFEVRDASQPAPSPAPELPSKKKTKKGQKVSAVEPPKALVPPVRRPTVVPFSVGEKLQYDIRYLGLTAGYLNLEVHPEKIVNGRKVQHLIGKAKTVKLFEMIYRVDDMIESFWDYDGLYSHRFTMNLDESKQSRKLIELYDYDKKKSFYWDRVDHSEKGFSEKKEEHDIKLWSQDILSSMYFVRSVDLPKNPGEEVKFPVVLDGKPWETVVKFLKQGSIYANGKNYDSNIYQIENYENGQPKNRENTLWISQDERRYILRVEAKVKVGSFAVALDKVL